MNDMGISTPSIKVNGRKIYRYDVQKAMQVLIDNGIEKDEAATVIQAVGYALLGIELDSLIDWNETIK